MILDTATQDASVSNERRANGDVRDFLASPAFVAVAFSATVVQVLGEPLIGTLSSAAWTHPLPQAVVVATAAVGSALQASFLFAAARAPVVAFLGTLASYLLLTVALGVPTWTVPMQLVVAAALLGLSTTSSAREATGWLLLTLLSTGVTLSFWAAGSGAPLPVAAGFVIDQALAFTALTAASTALGLILTAHARRASQARQQADRAAREQEERIRVALDGERSRIAQELHDVAAQHIAGLISLCDASVMLAPTEPSKALHLVEEVRAEGRFAAASLYGALGDLRAVDGQSTVVTPDLRSSASLAEFWTKRGMLVTLNTEGDLDGLPAVVSTIAYRGTQEALANAAKHAPGSDVSVNISATVDRLSVIIHNTEPRGKRAREELIGLGWGLRSLGDRLRLVDGALHAGKDDRGGWVTRIDIPLPQLDGSADG